MFITDHAIAGAAIGLVARRLVPAFVAGMASHLVMDVCLHWGDERLDWDQFVEVGEGRRHDRAGGVRRGALIALVAPALGRARTRRHEVAQLLATSRWRKPAMPAAVSTAATAAMASTGTRDTPSAGTRGVRWNGEMSMSQLGRLSS